MRIVKTGHPFNIEAAVALPEHLHCIWTLPPGDADYKTRWALIKAGFSRGLPLGERRSASRVSGSADFGSMLFVMMRVFNATLILFTGIL